jgi:hypothetical protein
MNSSFYNRLSQSFRSIKNRLNDKMPSRDLTVFVIYSNRITAIDPEAERAYVAKQMGSMSFCKYTLLLDQNTIRVDGVPENRLSELKKFAIESGARSFTIREVQSKAG